MKKINARSPWVVRKREAAEEVSEDLRDRIRQGREEESLDLVPIICYCVMIDTT
jgi:hypothetical protein